MMPYLLLSISVLFAVINNALYHKLSGEKYNPFLFTAISSVIWLILLLPNKNIIHLTRSELFFGVLYGIVQALFLFFKMRAMSSGPVSITSVVSNCSMLLTTIFGMLFFGETASVFQIIGLFGIIFSVLLCVYLKSDMQMTLKWKLNCLLFFVFAASVGIIFKFFAKTNGNGSNMMLVTSLVMVLLLSLLSISYNDHGVKSFSLTKKQIVLALVCGVVTLGYNRLNITLTGVLPSIVFFPIFNGSIVLLCTLVGFFLFKERLSFKQSVGISLGIVSIVLVSGLIG